MNYSIAVIVNNGSEEIETIVPVDIWRRAGLNVSIISTDAKKNIVLQHGLKISCNDILINENLSKYHAIYLPGGEGSFNYKEPNCKKLVSFLKRNSINNKTTILACCATPYVLQQLELFTNNKATCYPTFAKDLKKYVDKDVNWDKNYQTSRAPGVIFDMALDFVAKILDKKTALSIAKQICYKQYK